MRHTGGGVVSLILADVSGRVVQSLFLVRRVQRHRIQQALIEAAMKTGFIASAFGRGSGAELRG
jgi:hypothetical protein